MRAESVAGPYALLLRVGAKVVDLVAVTIPPDWSGTIALTGARLAQRREVTMSLPFVLIDFENVQPAALGRLRVGETRVKVFLGQQQSKLALDLVQALQPFGGDAEYIQIQGSGPDAVDFHIAFYIGQISGAEPTTSFTIVSKDKGFDPLVRHLIGKGIKCRRLAEIPALSSSNPVKSPDASVVAANPSATTKSPNKGVRFTFHAARLRTIDCWLQRLTAAVLSVSRRLRASKGLLSVCETYRWPIHVAVGAPFLRSSVKGANEYPIRVRHQLVDKDPGSAASSRQVVVWTDPEHR